MNYIYLRVLYLIVEEKKCTESLTKPVELHHVTMKTSMTDSHKKFIENLNKKITITSF